MSRGPSIKTSAMTFELRTRLSVSAVLSIGLAMAAADDLPLDARGQDARIDSAVVRAIVRGFADSLELRPQVEPRPVRDDADGFDLENVLGGALDGASQSARKVLLRSMRIALADFSRARECAGAMAPDPDGTLHAGCPKHTEVWLALSLPSKRLPAVSLQEPADSLPLRDNLSRTVRVLALTRTPRGSVLDVFDVVVRRTGRAWQVAERRHLLTID